MGVVKGFKRKTREGRPEKQRKADPSESILAWGHTLTGCVAIAREEYTDHTDQVG